jgi:hypothetical protein
MQDSFLGFGAFKTTRQSEFLPEGVFFINYMAWRAVQRGRGAAPLRALTSAWHYGRTLSRLLGMVRRGRNANNCSQYVLGKFQFPPIC